MTTSATIAMRETDWSSLVYSVRNGGCILMLGPDAVQVRRDGRQVPIREGLAEFVKEKLGPGFEHLNPARPSAVAQVAVDVEDPVVLQTWVREFYDTSEQSSTVLEDLAQLPFKLVVNTFAGLGVGTAFSEVKPGTVTDHYDWTATNRPDIPEPTTDAPVVFNLYGTLDHPDSLVLSDEDRLECLVSIINDRPKVPARIRSALRDENTALLFLGFSLDQWQFRLLLHVLANVRRRFKSFALELERTKLDVETSLFYERGKIQFPDMEPSEFTSELRRRVGETITDEAPDDDAQPLPPSAPTVFLCHASEDEQHAVRLADALRRNGIGTWLDQQSLRSGDDWNQQIERVLGHEVDYVVVIQSESLVRKEVGYVNKEIAIARDRQRFYRDPRKFLLPVLVDGPEAQIPELTDLHAIDVTDESGTKRLIRQIKRDVDYARRLT